jgi:hypothetical protein
MKKILKILAAVVLLMTAVMPIVAGADTINVNYTDFTESDPYNRITIVSSDEITATITMGAIDTTTFLYKYYGDDFFAGQFIARWSASVSSASSVGSIIDMMMFSQKTGYYRDQWEALGGPGDYIYIQAKKLAGTDNSVSIILYPDSNYGYQTIYINPDTIYYFEYVINPYEGTYGSVELNVYADADYSDLVGTIHDILLTPDSLPHDPYDYIQPVVGHGGTSSIYSMTLAVYGLTLEMGAGIPAIETAGEIITYANNNYLVELSANMTSDGGGASAGFYLTSDNITWDWIGALDMDDDGIYNGYVRLSSYYADMPYWYYAYAFNAWGNSSTAVEMFTLTRTNVSEPTVATVGVTDISANGTTLWGTVYDDGGADTTGRFQYKVVGADNWTETENVTGLTSNHGYSAVLPAVPDGVYMMFRAVAENEHGIDYGEIEYFIWQDVGAMPTVTTGAALDVDYDSATLTGSIEDDGGGYCVVGFDFKRADEADWTRFEIGGEYETGGNFTYTLPGGLAEYTTYHFRALASNAAGYNEIGDYYTYALGDVVQFTTTERTGLPVVTLQSVAWHDNYTARATFRIEDDGGVVCHGNLRYRIPYGAWQYDDSVPNIEGLSTGDTATTYVRGLTYGAEYEFQAWVYNDLSGGFGYSNIIKYQLVAGDDTTTPPAGDAAGGISNQLTTWGLNNTGGRLLVVVGSMVLVFLIIVLLPGHKYQEYVRYTVPVAGCIDAVLLIFWMSVGYVPVLLTVGILIAAAGTIALFVVRLFRGRGAPAGD